MIFFLKDPCFFFHVQYSVFHCVPDSECERFECFLHVCTHFWMYPNDFSLDWLMVVITFTQVSIALKTRSETDSSINKIVFLQKINWASWKRWRTKWNFYFLPDTLLHPGLMCWFHQGPTFIQWTLLGFWTTKASLYCWSDGKDSLQIELHMSL